VNRRGLRIAVGVAAVLLGACTSPPAAVDRQDEAVGIVLQGRVFAETDYPFVEWPREDTAITLVANETNVLQARRTATYYWPLTNSIRTDREQLDEPVGDTLRITADDGLSTSRPLTSWVLQRTEGERNELFVGAEAETAFAAFEQGRDAYLRDDVAYRDAMRRYRSEVDELVRQSRASGRELDGSALPPTPEPPEAFRVQSTPIADGYVLALDPGRYTVELLDASGRAIPGASRDLHVVPRGPAQISYRVVPEDRWTDPDRSDPDAGPINARPGSVLYLEPFWTRGYDVGSWRSLSEPQARTAGRAGTTWIEAGGEVPTDALDVGGTRVRLDRYDVVQRPGRRLGYEIVPTRGERAPDLTAFRVEVGSDAPLALDLVGIDAADTRQIGPVSERSPMLVAVLLPLAPLGAWMVVAERRRRRLRALQGVGLSGEDTT
jgi:hypothetical protein